MTDPLEQFADLTRQGQQAALASVQNWADAVQRLGGTLPSLRGPMLSPEQLVNTAFDYAQQVLSAQRQIVLSLVENLTPAFDQYAQAVVEGTKKVAESVTENTVRFTEQATDAAGKAVSSGAERAKAVASAAATPRRTRARA